MYTSLAQKELSSTGRITPPLVAVHEFDFSEPSHFDDSVAVASLLNIDFSEIERRIMQYACTPHIARDFHLQAE